MFSKERLSETLCYGYFAMLGTMSADVRGLQLLDRWRIFNMSYHIVDLKQRPDLIKLLLSHFDYSLQGHPRVLLSKALTGGSKEIRIHATTVLRKHASRSGRAGGAANGDVGDSQWALQMLVTQLYDPEIEVCATAIKILEEACNKKENLEYIVKCRPSLDHLGEIGAPLLLRFLSTSIGYHYLDGLDYISNEMDDWFLGRNDTYVGLIEASLARSFAEIPEDHTRRLSIDSDPLDDPETDALDAHVPPHFYKELARTAEGCKLLRDKGHFQEFASTIRDHVTSTSISKSTSTTAGPSTFADSEPEQLLKLKGCLWAIGNVASMPLGAPFLEDSDVVPHIVRIAQEHPVLSLRGTAFFVLGLVSRSVHGLEILSEHGWDSNTSPLGASLGLCIPTDLSRLFSLSPWPHETASSLPATAAQKALSAAARTDPDVVNARILELVMDLGNTVLKNRAMTELMHIKSKKAPGFGETALFRKVMILLEGHQFRLGVRRFAIDLFERGVMRAIVLDEESGSEDSGSESERGKQNGNGNGYGNGHVRPNEKNDVQSGSESGSESEGPSEGHTERGRSGSDA